MKKEARLKNQIHNDECEKNKAENNKACKRDMISVDKKEPEKDYNNERTEGQSIKIRRPIIGKGL